MQMISKANRYAVGLHFPDMGVFGLGGGGGVCFSDHSGFLVDELESP